MKNTQLNLHIDQKRAYIIMLSFALMLTLLGVLTVLTIGRDFSQLSSLLRSDYEYSALSKDSVVQDNYLIFDAGISFSKSVDDQSSINAEILMQSNSTMYTESVDWNASKLSTYGVAITRGLARQYGINVGDTLCSKHIVDGIVHDYIVEQILPDISCIRVQNERNFTEGIIIMGYDHQYADNLVHLNIIYSKIPIEELTSSISDMPVGILYRTDEILAVAQIVFPYILLYLLLSVLISFGFVTTSAKEVRYNIKRMIVLGFDINSVNTSFRGLINGLAFPSIAVALVISGVMAFTTGISFTEGVYLLAESGVESATVLISTNAVIKQLWRL